MTRLNITAPAGSLSTIPVGSLPGGFRLHVTYTKDTTAVGSQIRQSEVPTFDGEISQAQATSKVLGGEVVALSDWILLRDDGVAVFDAKITFAAIQPVRHLFDADLRGRVDIRKLENWKTPLRTVDDVKKLKGQLSVVLPIDFETAGPPPTDGSKALIDAAKAGEAFADLATRQYLATGTVQIVNGEIAEVNLHVVPTAVKHEDESSEDVYVPPRYSLVVPRPHRDPLIQLLLDATKDNWTVIRRAIAPEPVMRHIGEELRSRIYEARLRELWETMIQLVDLVAKEGSGWDQAQPVLDRIRSAVEFSLAAENVSGLCDLENTA
jgi:hypothetical protein